MTLKDLENPHKAISQWVATLSTDMTTIESNLVKLKLLTRSLRNPKKGPMDNIWLLESRSNVHDTVCHTPDVIPNLHNPRPHLHDFKHLEPFFPHDHHSKRSHPNYDQNRDHVDDITRRVKIDASEFDCRLDPEAFLPSKSTSIGITFLTTNVFILPK